ncbi:MAG: hypothetical protein BIFFINMI_02835 [Phycisphaerae bacterium]|nr:hypothetical protein [Phycisphaerae bacterium]
MSKLRFAVLAALALPPVAAVSRADTVVLKGGYEVTGEVLKQDAQSVVVDIGVTVLRVPRAQIAAIRKGEAEAPTTQPAEAAADADKWQLFRTAKPAKGTIEQVAARNSEAVVMVTSPGGLGSGFIINPDGYLITNYHVIANETRIKVTVFRKTDTGFENHHFKKVRIVAINPFVDLALLRIEDEHEPFKFVYLADIGEVEVGQDVFAIGNPLGLTRTVSQGIVSTKNRNFEGRLYIQTTTDINPGNSGGPLFNLRGEVIGVTSMGYIYLGGLNFAIPVDVVRRFILNRDAFAYDEDNPNAGFRYLQPAGRVSRGNPPAGRVPTADDAAPPDAPK